MDYSVLKSKEILTYVMTWMNFEEDMLSEIRQPKRTSNIWFHLHELLRVVKFTGTVEWWLLGVGGRWNTVLLFNGYRISVLYNEEFYGWMVVMAKQRCECT